MMTSAINLVVFFIGLCFVVGANTGDVCKVKPPIKEDFELLKIAGRWYEFARYPNIYQNLSIVRCYSVLMTADGNDIRTTSIYIEKNGTSWEKRTLEGKITSDPDTPGKVLATIPSVGLKDTFNIVDAKYDDYVIFYHCNIAPIYKNAWIFTREEQLSDVKKKNFLEKLKSLKIDTEHLEFDPKQNCE